MEREQSADEGFASVLLDSSRKSSNVRQPSISGFDQKSTPLVKNVVTKRQPHAEAKNDWRTVITQELRAAEELTAQQSAKASAVPQTPLKRSPDAHSSETSSAVSPATAAAAISPPKPVASPSSIDKDKEKLHEWEAKMEQERQESEKRKEQWQKELSQNKKWRDTFRAEIDESMREVYTTEDEEVTPLDLRLERKSAQALLSHMDADLQRLEQMEQVVNSLLDDKMLEMSRTVFAHQFSFEELERKPKASSSSAVTSSSAANDNELLSSEASPAKPPPTAAPVQVQEPISLPSRPLVNEGDNEDELSDDTAESDLAGDEAYFSAEEEEEVKSAAQEPPPIPKPATVKPQTNS